MNEKLDDGILRLTDPITGNYASKNVEFQEFLNLTGQSFPTAQSNGTYQYRFQFVGRHAVTGEETVGAWSLWEQ